MTDPDGFFGTKYRDLYAPYYRSHGNSLRKREISAAQTVAYITNELGSGAFNRLIDIGAGEGSVLSLLDAHAFARELFAVEVSETGISAIKSKKISLLREAQLFDGYRIPYPDKYFDLAIAIHVIEHVEHERLFLKEMNRVARHIWIEVPLEHGFRIRRAIAVGRKYGHINFYSKETLQSLLESVGFKVLKCKVRSASLEYDQYLSGKIIGWIKNIARRIALIVAPNLAPRVIAYNGFAHCECTNITLEADRHDLPKKKGSDPN